MPPDSTAIGTRIAQWAAASPCCRKCGIRISAKPTPLVLLETLRGSFSGQHPKCRKELPLGLLPNSGYF